LFRILYLFVWEDPASWVAYLHAAVMFGLMGLTYVQSSRRGVGFMIVFLTMAGIFMVDIFGYIPFLVYITMRDRSRASVEAAASDAAGDPARASAATTDGGPSAG
jgi:hypothetical protein